MMGHWTSLLQILNITPRHEVLLRCFKDGHPSESSMQKTKCPASLVCHVVDVVIPVHILLYGDAKVLGTGVKGVAVQLL